MKSLYIILFILLFSMNAVGQTTYLKGRIVYLSSSHRPAIGIKVSASTYHGDNLHQYIQIVMAHLL